ncbi:MAG: hypothetical protein NVSMB18_06100 [Acetobacteraceae bacterium]
MRHNTLTDTAMTTLRAALRKSRTAAVPESAAPEGAVPEAEAASLAGTSFLQLEPDLVKESGLRSRQMSGWAMGGIAPVSE